VAIFAVHKPRGMTSHDVVNIVRKKTGVKRVGHGGTLDPLAEGVLVIAVGRENTKLLDKFVKGDKEYVADIKLGENSTTDDAEGEKEKGSNKKPDREEVQKVLKQFVGRVQQIPPVYSAIKQGGRPIYKRARKGQEVVLEPRIVEIKEIELLDYEYPVVKIRVVTGPGVYIRSLARDLGNKLETGGYLSGLLRTRVANFKLKDAMDLEKLNLNSPLSR
jgi:tRNA pseudouridine55 synthase